MWSWSKWSARMSEKHQESFRLRYFAQNLYGVYSVMVSMVLCGRIGFVSNTNRHPKWNGSSVGRAMDWKSMSAWVQFSPIPQKYTGAFIGEIRGLQTLAETCVDSTSTACAKILLWCSGSILSSNLKGESSILSGSATWAI